MTVQRGAVVGFDEHRGTGLVQGEDGGQLFFHCTAVADGSRAIAVGSEVMFEVVAGHNGRWEATSVTKVQPGGGEGSASGPGASGAVASGAVASGAAGAVASPEPGEAGAAAPP
jgi:cold shock CspA family protein